MALAIAVAVLGYAVVSFSFAQIAALRAPAMAYRLAPYDGRLTARLAQSLVAPDAAAADRARSDELAVKALRQDPTAVPAVTTLAVNAQIRGDSATARRLFGYAERLSRRDLQTQLWAIEDAVGRGDIGQALRHYDVALRTNVAAADLLFPVLASAIADPPVRTALARLLATEPSWGLRFANYIAASGPQPRATASLLAELSRTRIAVPEQARVNVVNALLAEGSFDEAWSYYATLRGGGDRRRSRDPRFAGVAVPSQMDWMAVEEAGATAVIEGGGFDFSVPANGGGPMLRQTQLLPTGRYRLTGRSERLDQARPYWLLTCQGGRELGRVDLPPSGSRDRAFGGTFDVPRDCPLQTLMLVARSPDAATGASGRILRAELGPAE